MKVLYLLNEYPQLSESYIRAEIDYVRSMGVQVKVWSGGASPCRYQDSAPFVIGVPTWKEIQEERPDVVHVHYVHTALARLPEIERSGVPLTVRGHSFDYQPERVNKLLDSKALKNLFLFPQFAENHPEPRVEAMTCAADSRFYRWESEEKEWDLVYRAGAGIPGKDLETFVRVAKLCNKQHRFERLRFALFVTTQHPETATALLRLNESLGYPAEIHVDRQHEEIARVARRAGQCFRSHDPQSHPYGMPQGIAEAMMSGCRIVARNGAQEFIGDAGACFSSDEMAAEMLLDPLTWTDNERYLASMAATEQGMRYETSHVLVPLLAAWDKLKRKGASCTT